MRVPVSEAGQPMTKAGTCQRCGYMSSQDICKACMLLEGLNKGLPNHGIGRARPGQKKRAPVLLEAS